jgi:predicted enzyme related to lactoylglutathione lyase
MTEVAKPVVLAGRGGLWLRAGTVQLHLGVEADFRPARKAHPAFLVRDLAAVLAVCRAHGCTIKDDEPPLEGYRWAHVFDSFGNRIELMENDLKKK